MTSILTHWIAREPVPPQHAKTRPSLDLYDARHRDPPRVIVPRKIEKRALKIMRRRAWTIGLNIDRDRDDGGLQITNHDRRVVLAGAGFTLGLEDIDPWLQHLSIERPHSMAHLTIGHVETTRAIGPHSRGGTFLAVPKTALGKPRERTVTGSAILSKSKKSTRGRSAYRDAGFVKAVQAHAAGSRGAELPPTVNVLTDINL